MLKFLNNLKFTKTPKTDKEVNFTEKEFRTMRDMIAREIRHVPRRSDIFQHYSEILKKFVHILPNG